jgi:hypothetical protein
VKVIITEFTTILNLPQKVIIARILLYSGKLSMSDFLNNGETVSLILVQIDLPGKFHKN